MLRMSSRPLSTPRAQLWAAVFVLAMVVAFVIWDAVVRSRHVLATTDRYGVTVDAPASQAGSSTGYADGKRSLLLPAGAADTAHWIMQTQAMIEAGDWRIRRVDYDNAPAGREVHWALPLHGWLAGLAWIDHLISGRPIGQSVERSVLYSGPVMFAVLLMLAGGILWRRFGPVASALFALGAVALYPFYLDFTAGYADHHGLANACALVLVLALLVGWSAGAGARCWFTLSAVAGGIGLWISAATLVPVLAGCGLGVMAAFWIGRRSPGSVPEAGLFRWWGGVGAGVSLVAYAVEYFPSHLGWRLEVNHPLYAFAWFGAGEILRAGALAARHGIQGVTGRDRVAVAMGTGLLVLLPLVIVVTGERTFTVADPFMWRLHALYISEFQSLGRTLAHGLSAGTVALCLPGLGLMPAAMLAGKRSTSPELRAQAFLALLPAVVGWLLACQQVRWLGLAYALSVPALALGLRAEAERAGASSHRLLAWLAAGVLIFLPGLVLACQRAWNASEFTTQEIHQLAERDVAHWLRQRAGTGRVVIAGMPTPTTRLIFSGGLAGMGTLYWENAAGLKAAAALFAAPTPDVAKEIAARAGVTHIVLFSWDAFEVSLAKLARKLPDDAPLPPDLFVAELLSGPVAPSWLKPLAFPLPEHPALAGAQVRIWEVTPSASPAAPAVNAANYFLELRRPDLAARLTPLLEEHRGELSANIMLAGIASRQRDAAAFTAAIERVRGQMAQAAALSLEEQLRLVVVLVVAGQEGPARAQLQQAMRKVDENTLRHLSSGALSDLFALTNAFEVPWPDPAMQALARRLQPPAKR